MPKGLLFLAFSKGNLDNLFLFLLSKVIDGTSRISSCRKEEQNRLDLTGKLPNVFSVLWRGLNEVFVFKHLKDEVLGGNDGLIWFGASSEAELHEVTKFLFIYNCISEVRDNCLVNISVVEVGFPFA